MGQIDHCIQWSPVERRRDGDGDLRLRTRSISGQYARVSSTCRNRLTRRQSWVQVVGRPLMIGVLLLAACDDGQSTSSPTTGPETTAIHATTVAAASPTCQGPVTLQQVSTAFAKVIGTSPVFAAGMDSAGVVQSSVVSGRLEGKILWVVDVSMIDPVTVTVAKLDATLAVGGQPPTQSATLEPTNALPSPSDPTFREYPSGIAASGPGCVTVTARWPANGTWTATLLLTDG